MAFRPGIVDLPTDAATAPLVAITLPDILGDADMDVPFDINFDALDADAQLALNISRREDITLQDEPHFFSPLGGGGGGGAGLATLYGSGDRGAFDRSIERARDGRPSEVEIGRDADGSFQQSPALGRAHGAARPSATAADAGEDTTLVRAAAAARAVRCRA